MPNHPTPRKMLCVSCYCPGRKACDWRHHTFAEIKAAKEAGQSADRFQPGQVCPKSLHRALHSFSGADERWAARIATGLTDADLRDAIGDEFGEWHQGCLGAGYTAMRNGPKIWFGSQTSRETPNKYRKPDLQGQAIVAVVREFLGVPLPQKASPAPVPQTKVPWAGLPLMQMMEART
jgi:hypothetical protein